MSDDLNQFEEMAITHGHGNPNWTRDETILALDLYFDCGSSIASSSDKRVKALSQLLRSLPYHTYAARKVTFRNADGVAFKLQNLHQLSTGKGLANVSNMDRTIWNEFGKRPDAARQQAKLIRTAIRVVEIIGDKIDEDLEFAEGGMVLEAHKRRERNKCLRHKLIAKRKALGPLSCDLCNCIEPGHEFGAAIFETHHLLPLAEGMERKTKLKDLALLCANCHRVFHRAIAHYKRWLTIPEANSILNGKV